jgi:PPOX class probable F420-dependent enzyme
MTTLADFAELAGNEHGFLVVATTRADGTVQASVVTAGVVQHPQLGTDVVVFVAAGRSAKLAHLRARPTITFTARNGPMWATVEGTAEIIGPDDNAPDAETLRVLLRDAFKGAGGTHDDWDEYDRVMREERRAVVFVTPTRVYSNG